MKEQFVRFLAFMILVSLCMFTVRGCGDRSLIREEVVVLEQKVDTLNKDVSVMKRDISEMREMISRIDYRLDTFHLTKTSK